MKPTHTTTTHLPPRVDSSILAKHRHAGEPLVVLKLAGVGNTAPYDFRGKGTRSFIFRFESSLDGHILRVPLHLWQDNHAHLAHELMDQRHLTHAMIVTLDLPAQPASAPPQAAITTQAAEGGPAAADTGTAAATQTHTFSNAEMGATDTSPPARNVVGPGEEEPTVAPTSGAEAQSKAQEPEDALPLHAGRPLHTAVYEQVLQPKRLKALSALLGTDEALLRRAIAQPGSGVELATAGWVRRTGAAPAA